MHRIATGNWRSAELSDVDQALCKFADKLSLEQRTMTRDDVEALRLHGLSDEAVHDAAQVIAYFNYITRIADALGVENEDFIRAWESPFGK